MQTMLEPRFCHLACSRHARSELRHTVLIPSPCWAIEPLLWIAEDLLQSAESSLFCCPAHHAEELYIQHRSVVTLLCSALVCDGQLCVSGRSCWEGYGRNSAWTVCLLILCFVKAAVPGDPLHEGCCRCGSTTTDLELRMIWRTDLCPEGVGYGPFTDPSHALSKHSQNCVVPVCHQCCARI